MMRTKRDFEKDQEKYRNAHQLGISEYFARKRKAAEKAKLECPRCGGEHDSTSGMCPERWSASSEA